MTHPCKQLRTLLPVLLCLVVLAWTGIAIAQLPIPPSTQFDITGFLQTATVDTPGSALSGGTLTVNGHLITVPANTIVIFPAAAFGWGEVFTLAPSPYGGTYSGLAMADIPAPLGTYEVQVQGNRVGDTYIAGLIYISKEFLGTGAGFINFIDYTLGEMRVGGAIGSSTTGARVRLNDPSGRYGRNTTSPDVRFTVDPDNPTIMAGSGYPMCFPRVAPAGPHDDLSDPLCPQDNRPLDALGNPLASITTANLTQTIGVNPGDVLTPPPPGTFPDSTQQAPFEVGDYITYSGTLVADCVAGSSGCVNGGTTEGPWTTTTTTWIAAHTIVNNTAIYTFPGSNPAYLETEVFILGTGGLTVLGVGEAAIRTRFEGMTTDVADPTLSGAPQRIIHLYGIDLDAGTGATTDRDWGTIGVDPGPAGGLGAVKGRWRFRPPCAPFGTVVTKPDKQCVMNAAGTFLPVTREMRSVIEGLQSQNPALAPPAGTATTSANGLFYGQYHAPILEYIFPENIPGTPIVENNFNSFPFLACGGYASATGVLATAPLSPWPSNIAPGACASSILPPGGVTASATPNPAAGGALVTLSSAVGTGSLPFTFLWTQTAGTAVTLNTPTGNSTTFTAPLGAAPQTLTFQVTVTNSVGSATGTVTVNVDAANAPTVSYDKPPVISQPSGVPITITATGVDPNGLPVTVLWRQTGGSPSVVVPNPLVCGPSAPATPQTCALTINVTLPPGAASTTILLQAEAVNSLGIAATPDVTTVTVIPQADTLSITSVVYRTGKQRMDITVTSNVVSPADNVFLDPYVCEGGTLACPPLGTYNPDPSAGGVGNIFVNNGNGLYAITLVGAPKPVCNNGGIYATPCSFAPIVVRSSFGGVSPPSPVTKIRQ